MKMIGIGDNVCDKYRTLGTMFPGGQALNVSVYCRQAGWETAYLGVFGKDAVGDYVKKTLDDFGIDRSHFREYDGENGYAVVDLIDGDRVFVTSNKGGVLREHPIRLEKKDLDYLASFDLVYTSNNSYFDDELKKVRRLKEEKKPGMLISYDFSYRWFEKERWEKVCPNVDFAFLSCSDLDDEKTEELTRSLIQAGCGAVIATRGGKDVVFMDSEETIRYQPKLVQAVDTLGAGDSFASGFLMEYASRRASGKEKGIRACLDAGAALSAKTCMVQGAFGHGTKLV